MGHPELFQWGWGERFICLDTYILRGVYRESGICIRDYCGAEPTRDIELAGFVRAVGRRDRAATSDVAADSVKAFARAAGGWLCGIDRGRTATSLSVATGTISGGGCVARSVSAVLVRSRRCSRTPSGPHGSVGSNEKEDNEKATPTVNKGEAK